MHLTLDLLKPTVVYEETSRECSNKGKQKYIPASPFVTLYPFWHLHVLFVVMVLLLMTVFFIILMVSGVVTLYVFSLPEITKHKETWIRISSKTCIVLRFASKNGVF